MFITHTKDSIDKNDTTTACKFDLVENLLFPYQSIYANIQQNIINAFIASKKTTPPSLHNI